MTNKSAGWGWEIVNINNNGADAYFEVKTTIHVSGLNVDVAYVPTARPGWGKGGFAEVLCQVFLSPVEPVNPAQGAAFLAQTPSPDFATPVVLNPDGSTVGQTGAVLDGMLCNVILKSWVAEIPIDAATSRHVSIPLDLDVPAGYFLACHMDHMGVPGDVEMQITLQY